MKDSEMKNTKNDKDLEFHKICDSALAFGILIPAGVGVALVSAPISIPLAGAVGATAGFGSAFAVSHLFSYEDLYDVHYKDRESVLDKNMVRERNKENYNIIKNNQHKIPSPSFAIKKFIENFSEPSKSPSNSR